MRILFVDDMPDTRDVFRLAFGIQGHDTRVAGSGQDAVAAVREEDFDVIVMDVEMPGMNGWEAVRQIRLLEGGKGVPIVMFTAYSSKEDQLKAREVGANDVLQKPMLPQELIANLEKIRIEYMAN
jgi:two-component system copper resistance phosphate regulon response regulator CusR